MRITSLEIKQYEFEKSFRGYNVDEVNNFLGNIAQEWDRMLNEIKMLQMQLDIAEKEASKLREVEMTLIKTLRTAEDTSSKITEDASLEASKKIDEANYLAKRTIESANLEAKTKIDNASAEAKRLLDEANYSSSKTVDEANIKASQILREAENTSKILVSEAETKAKDVQKAAEIEIAELDAKYNALESNKTRLLNELKSYNNELSKLIGDPESVVISEIKSSVVNTPETKLEILSNEAIVPIKEEYADVKAPVDFFKETSERKETDDEYTTGVSLPSAVNKINLENEDKTNLELIEGIGPKIKDVLYLAGIRDFRTLATTPEYRLKDILNAAGPHFAAHDPSTWNEQALLAENGHWEKLEALKDKLVAGRAPKEEEQSANADGTNTEEMLDKVNKVKAAIRKAMVEKSENSESSRPIVEHKSASSGSFFDSI